MEETTYTVYTVTDSIATIVVYNITTTLCIVSIFQNVVGIITYI